MLPNSGRESLEKDQKLPQWPTARRPLGGGLEQRMRVLSESVFAAPRVIKVQVKAASPTKRLQLRRWAGWGQFEGFE